MPRSQFAFGIQRGGTSIRNVQRYLRASGLDDPRFVSDTMRQRHIHPRHKRGKTGETPVPSTFAAEPTSSVSASGRDQPVSSLVASNPFALLGKKPDAPAS